MYISELISHTVTRHCPTGPIILELLWWINRKKYERTKSEIKQLLEAGVHLGHKTLRWNPKMKKFIFGEKNSIHIIDLTQTVDFIKRPCPST